ncbi:sugar ABC transporter substrate-binding protein [Prosthecomicrobium pneumaticum]|uniref:Ribose transport system substrate-binding protein n=1 Tax=Prosthecomicrobium pneumaticum TaxID=81895 RepID=A0A7W9FQW8_9HYPH|nr:sugar ABC transporter substrate-binding protein [Prosthecomicrobium pneumaticum]MBB5755173.1 ribose transport system substrate-binding protein [Prosthecomicrobium pneumaticum]
MNLKTLKTWTGSLLAGTIIAAATISGAAAQDKKPQIAVLLFSRGFEFMVALDQGARKEAEKLGAEITVLDGQSNTEVQTRQIEDLIVKGVDAIVISPNNSTEIVPAVRRANEAKIPVVALDAVVGEGADVVTYVGFDNAAGGKVAAEYVASLGKKKVLELQGAIGAYHAQKRGGGFEGEAQGKFEVLPRPAEWLAENAQAITADVVTANPDVDAIFSHNDEMIRGVLAGLRQIGKTAKVGEDGHIAVVAVDGTPLALQRIRDGEQDATVNQDPFEMGALAVRSAVAALKGETVPAQQLLPPTLVTKENVDDPALWGNIFKP